MPSPMTPTRSNKRPKSLGGQVRPMQRDIPVQIMSITPQGDNLLVTFNQPVSLKGIPQYAKTGGIFPTAASMTSPTTMLLTYPSGEGPPATNVTVPPNDPALRSVSGGYVTPTDFDL